LQNESSSGSRKRSGRPLPPRLNRDYEFRRAYNKGKSFASGALVTYAVKRKYGGIRIGITTGKRVGNAVCRNRARRIIRAAFRDLRPQMTGHWELVFVARSRTPSLKMQAVRKDMLNHLRKAQVIPPENKA